MTPPPVELLSGLAKDPLFYLIGLFAGIGAFLMKGEKAGPTWFVGLALIAFAALVLLIHMINIWMDGAFKRRYEQALDAQGSTIESQKKVIRELSKNTIAAHGSVAGFSHNNNSGSTSVTSTSGD